MRPFIGQDIDAYMQRIRPRAAGSVGFISDRGQIAANTTTTFELPLDTRGPGVLTRLSLSLDADPYPQAAAVQVFIQDAQADILKANGDYNRDVIVRNRPHVYATPLGGGGIYGGMDFAVGQVIRHGSIIEVTFEETGGVAYDGSLTATVFYPTKDPQFTEIGDTQLLEQDNPDELPEPTGRVYLVGDQVTIGASGSGDLVFNLRTSERTYVDGILISMDSLNLFAGGLAALPLNVQQFMVQYEGMHAATPLMKGPPVNLLTLLGGTGSVGARLFDRSLRVEPGSDIILTLNNTDGANPHTVYGCALVHRY